MAVTFKRPKSPERSSSPWLFNASVHLHVDSSRAFQEQTHIWEIYIYICSRMKCHFFPFLFPGVFPPSRCQQDSVTVPSARYAGSQSQHVHRRRADSSAGPPGPNPQLTPPPSSAHILKKNHGNQLTLYLQLEQGGSLFCTCLLAFLLIQSFSMCPVC